MARTYWLCNCGVRVPVEKRKCAACGSYRRKKHVAPNAVTLRDDTYEIYKRANAAIHGVTDESCGVCGKPRSQERRHDRDHGHHKGSLSFGKPRGLACVHCNMNMPRNLTLDLARLIVAYLERVEAYYQAEEAAA